MDTMKELYGRNFWSFETVQSSAVEPPTEIPGSYESDQASNKLQCRVEKFEPLRREGGTHTEFVGCKQASR